MFQVKIILEAIFLGLLQGLTEFLPVSSSGHLVIAQHFCPELAKYPLSLDVTLHLGTLLALCVYFAKDLIQMLRKPRTWVPIIITTLVTAAIVFPFKSIIESTFNSPQLACIMLFFTGVFLFLAARETESKISQMDNLGIVSPQKAFGIGVAQALAVLPGISRSGTTISAGVLLGLKAETAARFSFLIAIPIIFGAGLLELPKITAFPSTLLLPYVLGFLTSFGAGLWAIKWLLKLLANTQKSLKYFAYYCWVASLVFFILLTFA